MICRSLSRLCPLFLSLVAVAATASAQTDATPVEDEVLVRWSNQSAPRVLAPGQDPARWQQQSLDSRVTSNIAGARVARTFAGTGWSLVRVPRGFGAAAARARLSSLLGSANVAFNSRRTLSRVPNDPGYGLQWQWPQIKAPDAWNLKTGSSDVVVAVIDSGVDLNHPDLKANLWKNPREIVGNGLDDDKNGYVDDIYGINALEPGAPPQDNNGHGTHIAGLIGAVGNNGTGVAGACWNVKIMALKFSGSAANGNDAEAIQCLEYAVKMKQSGVNLRVISNSWSGSLDNPALKAAFQLAEKAGILNICASGNGKVNTDSKPQYPASYTLNSILSVAASDQSDAPASFSNYGPKSVDIAAPGTTILSLQRGGGTVEMSGTSMATPIVAGAAALLVARDGALSASAIKDRLIKTADPIPTWKGLTVSGGRLNLARALTNAVFKVSGLVYRQNGTSRAGLAGALIKVDNKVRTSADKSGKYYLNDLMPGTYSVTASLNGYSFATTAVVLPRAAGEAGAPNAIVDFEAQTVPSLRYSIAGKAYGTDGRPKTGVSIFISGIPNAVALSDSSGNYSIRDRASGNYQLSASDGVDAWRADPSSVRLPTANVSGAPNGIVNFYAAAADKTAPQITITTPKNGSILLPGSVTASGTASDVSGVKQIFFQLTRQIDLTFAFYDWTTQTWTSDANAPGVKGIKAVSGTSVNWSQALPNLSAASYSLRVWGLDNVGNESNGEADAVSSWDVQNSQNSARSATLGVKPSAGSS